MKPGQILFEVVSVKNSAKEEFTGISIQLLRLSKPHINFSLITAKKSLSGNLTVFIVKDSLKMVTEAGLGSSVR